MANSADPDQLASSEPTDLDLCCLKRQGMSGFSRTRVYTSVDILGEKRKKTHIRYASAFLCRYYITYID